MGAFCAYFEKCTTALMCVATVHAIRSVAHDHALIVSIIFYGLSVVCDILYKLMGCFKQPINSNHNIH